MHKFQKGRTGKLKFNSLEGTENPVVFDAKKHKLVQRKLVGNVQDENTKEEIHGDQEEKISPSSSKKKSRETKKEIRNFLAQKRKKFSKPLQDAPDRSSKRNTRKVTYREEEGSDLNAFESASEKCNKKRMPSLTRKKTIQRYIRSRKISALDDSARETFVKIGSSWIENDEDWRCFSAVDY